MKQLSRETYVLQCGNCGGQVIVDLQYVVDRFGFLYCPYCQEPEWGAALVAGHKEKFPPLPPPTVEEFEDTLRGRELRQWPGGGFDFEVFLAYVIVLVFALGPIAAVLLLTLILTR